ncbi:MAG: transketolase [Deltaproteobacteria bacterium]|nr:transketolase [Deltaproteobacteria bacterium]
MSDALHAFDSTDELCVNTIRFLAVDGVEAANSGHPGMPLGDAPMAYALWARHMRFDPEEPKWPGRDRFVLSAGHGSMLLYSLLHLTGYDMPLEQLKSFRQWGSHTPGHPEYDIERGIEMTTGPLGQGFATGVGMAIAERYLAERYNKPGFAIFDYNIYAITSDGDLMEGVSNEAASIAGHLGLGKLVYLYSDNRITIEGSTEIAFTEDAGKRFEALGWHVQAVDGNDMAGVSRAIEAAKAESTRPSIVISRTNIGFGSPGKQDSAEAHGAPLGKDEMRLTKEKLGWPLEPAFHIPDAAQKHITTATNKGRAAHKDWQKTFKAYAKAHPELAAELTALFEGRLDGQWEKSMPVFAPAEPAMATRSASGKVLNAIAKDIPRLIGGSADLAPSNNTYLKGLGDFQTRQSGRNLHFGVREHAMGSLMNGMALSGLIPFGGTFLIFSDYMRPAIRLAALMKLHVIYVFTHDSIGLGEDGPTHQPIEQLASLRAIPGLTVLRPADAFETALAWKSALANTSGPTALVLTRQNVASIDREKLKTKGDLSKGGYVLADADGGKPQVILIATGSEVEIALQARAELAKRGIGCRVVAMPSTCIFDSQEKAYRDSVLPPAVTARISIEAGATMGWHRYVGLDGATIGIDHFGASAPYKTIYERFGLTAAAVVEQAVKLLERK